MFLHFKIYKKQINGNSIHKIRQKVRKKVFFQIINGHDPFWPEGAYANAIFYLNGSQRGRYRPPVGDGEFEGGGGRSK